MNDSKIVLQKKNLDQLDETARLFQVYYPSEVGGDGEDPCGGGYTCRYTFNE